MENNISQYFLVMESLHLFCMLQLSKNLQRILISMISEIFLDNRRNMVPTLLVKVCCVLIHRNRFILSTYSTCFLIIHGIND